MRSRRATGTAGSPARDEGLCRAGLGGGTIDTSPSVRALEVSVVDRTITVIAVALLLTGAVLLVTDVGAAGLWIAVITVGVALVVVDGYRRQQGRHRG